MTDLLDMTYEKVCEAWAKIAGMSQEELNKIGDQAISEISEYPLYASSSNITYEEAILIALVLEGKDFVDLFKKGKK